MGNGTSSYLLPEQRRRKAQGLCVDCGIELTVKDMREGYIRCQKCRLRRWLRSPDEKEREKDNAKKYQIPRGSLDTEPPEWVKAWAREKLVQLNSRFPKTPVRAYPLDRDKCLRCQWVTYTGQRHWFCPLPYCGYNAGEEYEPENPLGTTVTEVANERGVLLSEEG